MPLADPSTSATMQSNLSLDARLSTELYARSGASAYGLSEAQFAVVLKHVAGRAEGISPTDAEEVSKFLSGLKLDELALAQGCVAGNQHAWDVFLTRYRESIYQSARSIARNEDVGRELADSLYAELYGLGAADDRRSKLALYSGRGSLAGWLRMVLAQSFVNQIRAGKRLLSLEEEEEEHGKQFAAPAVENAPPADERVKQATGEVLAALDAEERFMLASYFLDGRRLAEIGRMLGVHESTVSRKMEKLLKELRKRVRKELEARGMSRRQAEEALELDVRDLEFDVRAHVRTKAENSP